MPYLDESGLIEKKNSFRHGLCETACWRALLRSQGRACLWSALECAADKLREPYYVQNPQASRLPVPVEEMAKFYGLTIIEDKSLKENSALFSLPFRTVNLGVHSTLNKRRFTLAHE